MSSKPPPGHFSILYFASASSFTGKAGEILQAPLNVDRLYDVLEDRYSGIKDQILSSCSVTINLHYVDVLDNTDDDGDMEHKIIKEGDEVAIIPPVSSG